MKKIPSTKRIKKRSKSLPAKENKIKNIVDDDIENPMDFGGIPQRDLKKNLGCG